MGEVWSRKLKSSCQSFFMHFDGCFGTVTCLLVQTKKMPMGMPCCVNIILIMLAIWFWTCLPLLLINDHHG